MSKVSQLKQEAFQAGKKRDWNRALSLYDQILEKEKGNPTVINEMGDLCLKAGQNNRGVQHFLNAAAKYRQNGLTNNAVAIYKKVLRYDAENLNAHYYLAESRAGQGLLVEGEHHALVFLDTKEGLSGELQEIYQKRCVELLDMYCESRPVLENLLQVFRMWNMQQEAGRTRIRIACHLWDDQKADEARELVADALKDCPQLRNYPEHGLWEEITGTSGSSAASDFDAVDLSGPDPAPADMNDPAPADMPDPAPAEVSEPAPAPPVSAPSSAGSTDSAPVSVGDPFAALPPLKKEEPAGDDFFTLDDDDVDETSFDDLIAQATAQVDSETGDDSVAEISLDDILNQEPPPAAPETLDDLLSEDDADWNQKGNQRETITEEIGAQMGGDKGEDPSSLYETGMVYLEMGMHDQACEAFQKAAAHPDFKVRAHEMWGITLLRVSREKEAIEILSQALSIPEEGSSEHLGLLYHLGRAYEQAEQEIEAQAAYRKIQETTPNFLDVGRRLSTIESKI